MHLLRDCVPRVQLHDHSLHVPNIGSTAQTNYHSIIQNILCKIPSFYRPQSKVMFSEACWCRVCLMEGSATWGESAYKVSGSREGLPTEWGSVSWGSGHYSGQYTSYWNAFLYKYTTVPDKEIPHTNLCQY